MTYDNLSQYDRPCPIPPVPPQRLGDGAIPNEEGERMPSGTFFRLPPEKRETLLACARREFARVPFSEASINQIIRAAHIPRGSFYMYFTDKADLFLYLMDTYLDYLEQHFECLLERSGGDLFSAVLGLYDHMQALCRCEDPDEGYGSLFQIVRVNGSLQPDALIRHAPEARLERLREKIDAGRLDLRGQRDLMDMLRVLLGVAGAAVMRSASLADPAPERAGLVNILEILKRGMEKSPAAAVSST